MIRSLTQIPSLLTSAGTETLIVFTITDPGQPFNPFEHVHAEKPEIGGHGISLVKGLSCGVEYTREDGRNKVTVRINPAD